MPRAAAATGNSAAVATGSGTGTGTGKGKGKAGREKREAGASANGGAAAPKRVKPQQPPQQRGRENDQDEEEEEEEAVGELDFESFVAARFGGGKPKQAPANGAKPKANGKPVAPPAATAADDDDDDEEEEEEDDDVEDENEQEEEELEMETEGAEDENGNANDDDDDEEETHKRELAELSRRDPEFYAHLKSQAKELLDFGEDEPDAAADDDDNDNEDVDAGDDAKHVGDEDDDDTDDQTPKAPQLSAELLDDLEERAYGAAKDIRAARELLRLFRLSVRAAAAAAATDTTRRADDMRVDSVELHDRLVLMVLSNARGTLDSILKLKKNKKTRDPSLAPGFKSFSGNLRSFLAAVVQSLDMSVVSGESVLLDASKDLVPYLCSQAFSGSLGRKYVGVVLKVWSSPDVSASVRVAAYLRLRQAAASSKSLTEDVCRGAYVSFARSAVAPSTPEARERLGVQMRCLVELYGLDGGVSYRLAFQQIRLLAMHLRQAMASKTLESLKSVDSWQYVHCLRLWSFVVAAHYAQLEELAFPVVQLAVGTAKLVSGARFMPLRLHCADVVNRLCAATGLFAPTTGIPLDVLDSPEWFKPAVPSMDKAPDLDAVLRLKHDVPRMAAARDALATRAVELLRHALESRRFSVSFPETWVPTRLRLEAWRKRLDAHFAKSMSSHEALKRKTPMKKPKGERGKPAWAMHAERAVEALTRDADRWAERVRSARDGRLAGVTKPAGPADADGCKRFELQLRQADAKAKSEAEERADVLREALPELRDLHVGGRKAAGKSKQQASTAHHDDEEEEEEEAGEDGEEGGDDEEDEGEDDEEDEDEGDEDKLEQLDPDDFF